MTGEELLLRKMLSIIGFVLLGIVTLIGLVANGFIVVVICRDLFRSRKLSPTDQILSCLALSRLLWQTTVILHTTLAFFSEDNYQWHDMRAMLFIIWIFTDTASLWFATWLSCLYFSKIAIFSHPIFLQVKRRFSGLVPRLLLGSVILSAFMTTIFAAVSIYGYSVCVQNVPLLNNRSNSEIKTLPLCTYLTLLLVIPNFIPILIFLSSITLLIISLWKHIRRMQHNGVGVQDLNTHVHLTAIKALASFAILYMSSSLVGALGSALTWKNNLQTWMTFLFQNVMSLYPSGHAVILILVNPKLKQAWFRMLYHLKCCRSQAQS